MEAKASKSERRIILLGKTGHGKSSTGNTILGKEIFLVKASSVSSTAKYESRDEMVDGRKITVIDTPGIFDANRTEKEVKSLIQSLTECAPGVHAFIIVLKVGMYTAQEIETVDKISSYLGENLYKHSVVLFTHGEQLEGQTIKEFVKQNENLQELVDNCGGRCHVIDNKYWNKKRNKNNNSDQVKYLLDTIEKMVEENGFYTNNLLKILVKDIQNEIKCTPMTNFSPKEKCKIAKENVLKKLLIRLAGVATGTLTGALFGIAVELALLEIMKFIAADVTTGTTTEATVAGAGAVGGAGIGAAAGMDIDVIFRPGALAGAAGGGVVGYNASEEAESVIDAIKMTVKAHYDNAVYVIKKARQFPYCFKKSKQ